MRLPRSNLVGPFQGVAENEEIAAEVGQSIQMACTGHGVVLVHSKSRGRYGMFVGNIVGIWVWDCSDDLHATFFSPLPSRSCRSWHKRPPSAESNVSAQRQKLPIR